MTKLCRTLPDVCAAWRETGEARVGINRPQDAESRIVSLRNAARQDFSCTVVIEREEQPEGFRPPVILRTRLAESVL